jgi:hypothetical protein
MIKFPICIKKILSVALLVGMCSCSTEDILPTLEVTASDENLSEANGSVILTAQLNGPANGTLLIPFELSGTAQLNEDYQSSGSEFVFENGATTAQITLTGIQDGLVEGPETIILTINQSSNVLIISPIVITINLQDDDADTDGDGVLDSEDDCPEVPGPAENNGCPFLGFLINEVHYDPADGIAGDANNDGTRDPLQDEFIEFFNSGPQLDLSGYTVSDATSVRHTFPAGTIIPANGVIVLFGGGTPTGGFGGSIVQIASSGQLNMNNAGDFMTVKDAAGATIVTFDVTPLSDNPNESYTRNPDLTGDFVQHSSVEAANGAIYSPGVKLNGTNF